MTVVIRGLTDLKTRFGKLPSAINRATEHHIQRRELNPMATHMKAKAGVRRQMSIAATSVRYRPVKGGAEVSTGGGGGLASTLLLGAEFGGRRKPKRAYAYRSPRGTVYIARRRATQQFLPHLGRRGYWFWPTVRTDMRGIRGRLQGVIQDVIDGG
jgi:hypothetical protein